MIVERGDFWEFKARTAALDLTMADLRAQIVSLTQQRNALFDAFALTHALDPRKPMVLEDTDCSVTQP